MRLEEAREELKRFVKQKTTQQPAFLGVILDALDAAEKLDLYHGDAIQCYFEGDTLKKLPEYVTEIVFETEEEQEEFEARIKDMDKYRWHDLRKNPDDLPPEVNNGYMVKCRDVEQPFSAYWSKMGIFVDDLGDRLTGIVAWKEIEPFEGETE